MSLLPILIFSPSILLIVAAIIPAIALLIYVYKQDKLEKESWNLILKLVLFGALSTLLAQLTETLGIAALPYMFTEGSRKYNIALYYVVVAISEEGFKYMILKWRTWNSSEFNCRFDGVVYAASVSLGFALWENISYVLSYGVSAALTRAVTAVPGHACFGVFMGAFYGAARLFAVRSNPSSAKLCHILAIAVPVILHGTYDYIASGSTGSQWLFIAFIAVMFFVAYRFVGRLSRNDRYLY